MKYSQVAGLLAGGIWIWYWEPDSGTIQRAKMKRALSLLGVNHGPLLTRPVLEVSCWKLRDVIQDMGGDSRAVSSVNVKRTVVGV